MVFQVYRNMTHRTIAAMSDRSSSRFTRVVELVLQVLTTIIAAAIIGTSAHVYHAHQAGLSSQNPVWLPLWPDHFETTGNKVMIGTSSAIVFLTLLYIAISFFPKFSHNHQPKLSALLLVGVSTLCILLAISSLVVSSLLERRTGSGDTIRSWTCKFSGPATAWSLIPSNMSSKSFRTLCTQSLFSFYAMIPVLTFQTMALFLGVSRLMRSKQEPESPMMGDKSSVY
ncbi:hypothetical protein BT63DRAFT_146822 [Microthyrium microscopicum]|uniref:MARVEL domain-containing protein n=1 Tax=Microthyrium microscopicum TaxID=703497 RepID=A0A6A6UQC3_9PEZI|nr:hypothetical protein BT63DRAFT_146822 [Microthyrium microscopicum]